MVADQGLMIAGQKNRKGEKPMERTAYQKVTVDGNAVYVNHRTVEGMTELYGIKLTPEQIRGLINHLRGMVPVEPFQLKITNRITRRKPAGVKWKRDGSRIMNIHNNWMSRTAGVVAHEYTHFVVGYAHGHDGCFRSQLWACGRFAASWLKNQGIN